jgi:hypothetical protein
MHKLPSLLEGIIFVKCTMDLPHLRELLEGMLLSLCNSGTGTLNVLWDHEDPELELELLFDFRNGKMTVGKSPGMEHRKRPCNARNLAYHTADILQEAESRYLIPDVFFRLPPSDYV